MNATIETLLHELAAAHVDKEEHTTKRHPAVRESVAPYLSAADPVACQADWHRVSVRFDAAVAALVLYACEQESWERR